MVFYEDLDQHLKGNPIDLIGKRECLGKRGKDELQRRDDIVENKQFIDPVRMKSSINNNKKHDFFPKSTGPNDGRAIEQS
jgi:hypothetical protein